MEVPEKSRIRRKIPFARDRKEPKFFPVLAAVRIAQSATRLKVPKDEPIGVFKNTRDERRFITDKMVAKLLRSAASEVLNINPKISNFSYGLHIQSGSQRQTYYTEKR